MKIGIDIRTLMDTHFSGVSEYTYNIVKEILKQDTKNTYKLFYNSGRDIRKRMPKFNAPNAELVVTRYPNKIFNNIMQRIITWPNIDQLLGVDLFFMPNIGFISLSQETKKIITVHDLSFLRYPHFFSYKRRLWHAIIMTKRLLKGFDRIIAVSENTKKDIIELTGIKEEKVTVIYSGVGEEYRKIDQNKIQLSFKVIKKRYKLPEKFILSISTLEPRKNIDGLIRAYEKLRLENNSLNNTKLVIAGAKGWKFQDIIKTWKLSKFKKDIIFIGYVDPADKVYLYNLAELFVYPSFYEGFGFPPLEAMASGTPVITSCVSSLPELVGDGATMINPYNITELSSAMGQVLNDKELQNTLIQRGHNIARNFVWEDSACNLLTVIKG